MTKTTVPVTDEILAQAEAWARRNGSLVYRFTDENFTKADVDEILKHKPDWAAEARVGAVDLLLLADKLEHAQSGNPHPSSLLERMEADADWQRVVVANTTGTKDPDDVSIYRGEIMIIFQRREDVSIEDAKVALVELAHLIAVAESLKAGV